MWCQGLNLDQTYERQANSTCSIFMELLWKILVYTGSFQHKGVIFNFSFGLASSVLEIFLFYTTLYTFHYS